MSLSRMAKRRDTNEPEIIKALLLAGAQVWQLDQPVDLLVLYRGKLRALEVKTDKGKLTPTQKQFFADAGDVDCVGVVRSEYEALEFIGAIED